MPDQASLDRIADKWTVLIIGLLEQRPHRFGELLKAIDGILQKMLTQTLRSLEHDGLVDRQARATVPVTVEVLPDQHRPDVSRAFRRDSTMG